MRYKDLFSEVQDLSFLQTSYDYYKEFCKKLWGEDAKAQAMCSLDASVQDLILLSYLDYEEHFPDVDLHHASIIWANVIVNHTPLVWGKDSSDTLVLISPKDIFPFFVLYPQSNFKEAIYSEMPEEFPIEFLTLKTYFSMLYKVFFPEGLQDFVKLLQEYTDAKSQIASTMMYALKEHFEYLGDPNALSELFETVNKNYEIGESDDTNIL